MKKEIMLKNENSKGWVENLKLLEKLINKYNLNYEDKNFVIELFEGWIFNYFKGFDLKERDKIMKMTKKLKEEE